MNLIDKEQFNVSGSGVDTISVEVKYSNVSYQFKDLDPGIYAIRCFQDMNGNQKLDKGLFGPKEPWALTWNKEKRFPPRFEDISFDLREDLTIDLKLEL